jgi:hypothetical protein
MTIEQLVRRPRTGEPIDTEPVHRRNHPDRSRFRIAKPAVDRMVFGNDHRTGFIGRQL